MTGVLPLVALGSYTTVVLFVCGLCLSAREGDTPAERHSRGADPPPEVTYDERDQPARTRPSTVDDSRSLIMLVERPAAAYSRGVVQPSTRLQASTGALPLGSHRRGTARCSSSL